LKQNFVNRILISTTTFFAYGDPGDVFVIKGSLDIITDVEEIIYNLPKEFNLKQNYPNPFNRCTVIEFDLLRQDRVSLEIYNVLGEVVRKLLVRKRFPAGIHRVSWDGRLADGTAASSGVYLYKLSTSSGSSERKMLLLK